MANLKTTTIDGNLIEISGTVTLTGGSGGILTAVISHNSFYGSPTTGGWVNIVWNNVSSSGSGAVSTLDANATPPAANFDPANHANSNRGSGYTVGNTLESGYKPDNSNSAWFATVATLEAPSTITVDLATGNFFELDLESAGAITAFTISNPHASQVSTFKLQITQGSTARQISWGGLSAFKWPGGTGPTLTTTNNAVDILQFTTWDTGTSWYGKIVGQNFLL
jgi:hypothetical protein